MKRAAILAVAIMVLLNDEAISAVIMTFFVIAALYYLIREVERKG